jgi:hypothetical protein
MYIIVSSNLLWAAFISLISNFNFFLAGTYVPVLFLLAGAYVLSRLFITVSVFCGWVPVGLCQCLSYLASSELL